MAEVTLRRELIQKLIVPLVKSQKENEAYVGVLSEIELALATPISTPTGGSQDCTETSPVASSPDTSLSEDDDRSPSKRKNDANNEASVSVKRAKVPSIDGLKDAQRKILPDPVKDLENLWSLCLCLRGCSRTLVVPNSGSKRLPDLIQNYEKMIEDDNARKAFHTIRWRLLLIQVADIYLTKLPFEEELRKSQMMRTGKKPHGSRNVVVDWLTGHLFGHVDIHKLTDTDRRKTRVEYWLRIGLPLFRMTQHCGFMVLIAPCMRLSDKSLKATSIREFDKTPFLQHLIRHFKFLKNPLSHTSGIMQDWVEHLKFPEQRLRIEYIAEGELRAQHDLERGLGYWAQFIENPVPRSSQICDVDTISFEAQSLPDAATLPSTDSEGTYREFCVDPTCLIA